MIGDKSTTLHYIVAIRLQKGLIRICQKAMESTHHTFGRLLKANLVFTIFHDITA